MYELPKEVNQVIHTIERAGFEAVLVGGPVRDLLRGATPHDWDIATSARPEQMMTLFPKTIPTGVQHGTVTVLVGNMQVEVTTYRREAAYQDHRKPESVEFVPDLMEDLKRRDFTINAMAYRTETGIVDLFGGQEDLKNGIIRAVGDAQERFEEDALRMLRAVRFACKLDFAIEAQTLSAITEKAPLLRYISRERIAAELIAALCAPMPRHLLLLQQTGLATYCLPELSDWKGTEWETVVGLLERLPAEKNLRLAALFYREGQDTARCTALAEKTLIRLKLDNRTIYNVETILKNQKVSFPLSEPALKRLVRDVGEPLLEATLWLSAAVDNSERQSEAWVNETIQMYQKIKRQREAVFLRDLDLSGDDLKREGLDGKEIGRLLQALLEWVIEHPEQNRKNLLLERMRFMRKEGMR